MAATAMKGMTAAQRAALECLAPRMTADADAIGRAVWDAGVRGYGSNFVSIGASVAWHLRRKGYVTRLPDDSGWRITEAGRAALREGRSWS